MIFSLYLSMHGRGQLPGGPQQLALLPLDHDDLHGGLHLGQGATTAARPLE